MKKLFTAIIILISCFSFALITAESFSWNSVAVTFQGEIKFIEYEEKPAFAIDIGFHPNTLFLPKTIYLSSINLVVIKVNDDGELYECSIAPYAYASRVLNKVVEVGEGKIVYSFLYDNDEIPDKISGFDLDSKQQEVGSLLYFLPDDWFAIYKIKWGRDFTTLFDTDSYIDIDTYSKNSIAEVFKNYKTMTPNLEKLYTVYKNISTFEEANESIKNTTNEIIKKPW